MRDPILPHPCRDREKVGPHMWWHIAPRADLCTVCGLELECASDVRGLTLPGVEG